MRFLINIASFTLIFAAVLTASPKYRLVSGERGVILSIDNVQKEPAVQVELIDGNLTINVPESGVDSKYSKTYSLSKDHWADSVAASSSNGVVQIICYNFRLSIEDMQKKFSNVRFLLLISPVKTAAFDQELFSGNSTAETPAASPVITGWSLLNRDGLEFVTFTGESLKGAKIQKTEKGISVAFAAPVKNSSTKQKISKDFVVDSVAFGKDGTVNLIVKSKNGFFSAAKNEDSKLTLIFTDTREKDKPKVASLSPEKKYAFVVDTKKSAAAPAVKASASSASASARTVVYLIKDNVNIRRSPESKGSSNIIGKFAIGTRFVSDSKENSWYRIQLESGETGYVSVQMAADSASITSSQWDAIYNANGTAASKPVIDEFNSPGKDPLLTSKQKGAFKLDTASAKNSKGTLAAPVADSNKQVAQIKPYKKMGRDPFLPLTSTDFVRPKLPKVDKLTLVGVIYDPRDGIALFDETVDGKTVSFSMRVGEQVENGKLLRIYERKVVFLMQESDITYTVEKELLVKKE